MFKYLEAINLIYDILIILFGTIILHLIGLRGYNIIKGMRKLIRHWRWQAAKRKWFKQNIGGYACMWKFLLLVYDNGEFQMTQQDLTNEKYVAMAKQIMQRSDTEGFFLAWRMWCTGLIDLKIKSKSTSITVFDETKD